MKKKEMNGSLPIYFANFLFTLLKLALMIEKFPQQNDLMVDFDFVANKFIRISK